MNSFEVFILLELFISNRRNKIDNKILKNFRSIIISHIIRSSSYVSFMSNLTVNHLLMDKTYCSLLSSFKRSVRKAQKVYEGNL